MATYTTKKMAFVQLANSKSDVYDPPASTKGLVHNIIVHNTNSTSEVVSLYLHDGTSEYLLYKMTLATNETVQLAYQNEGLLVDASSKITGSTTTASKVTCLIVGSEESA